MTNSFKPRLAAIALSAAAITGLSAAASAASGTIRLTVVKAGWFVGGSGGSGTLTFRGHRYRLAVGGIDAGLVFGASKADLVGRVTNIRRASDVTGVYGAAGAGAAVGAGARTLVLSNNKGARLELHGRQVGLEANVDVSGLQITVQ
jgi:hypothetical protein